jgi:hypothetical protein
MYETHMDIMKAWPGGPAQLARDIGQKPGTVFHWRIYGRIPAAHWPILVEKAEHVGLAGVTFELLAKTNKPRGRVGRPPKS